MPKFRGVAVIGGVERQVEVSGNPAGRTTVRVDGIPHYDEKPFVARETVHFDVGGHAVTLTWRQPTLSRVECAITSGDVTATLGRVTSSGELAAPLDPVTRRRVQTRTLGVVLLLAGIGMFWWSHDLLQRGRYELRYLYAIPVLILGGLLAMLLPSALTRSTARRTQWVVMLVSLVATLGLGYLFTRWFLATFSPR